MLSIGRLAGPRWSAEYYLARQAGCPSDYYLGSGERRGRWIGGGARALGLEGEVSTEPFRALLRGISPDGATVLAEPVLRVDPRGKVPAEPMVDAVRAAGAVVPTSLAEPYQRACRSVDRSRARLSLPDGALRADEAARICRAAGLDPDEVYGPAYAAALIHVEDRVDVRLPGLDLTFSAPKSVSILFGLGAAEVAEQVRAGHEAAVGAALGYLERVAGHALRGHQGDRQRARRVPTQGFVAAAFPHRSNRCGDMQLHDHVVVANLLTGEDGQTSALDSRELYQQARTAGFLYQAALRHELTDRLGVAWTPVVRGSAEIAGVPAPLRRAFSKRRQQIEAAMARAGRSDAHAAQEATLHTRPSKPSVADVVGLRERWAAEAAEHGWGPRDTRGLLGRTEVKPVDPGSLADRLLASTGLTHRKSTFDRRDVLRGIAESLPTGAPLQLIEEHADRLVATNEVVPLLPSAGRRHYSTVDLLATEQKALTLAEALRDAGIAVVPPNARPATRALTSGQQEMVDHLLSAGAGVEVVVGRAGSGKTAGLAAAHRAWSAAGIRVIGTSLAAVTAHRLQTATGIPSSSLARLMLDAQAVDPTTGRAGGLPQDGVLVVDEAGMVGTRMLAELFEMATAARCKVVCVGDPHQLPSLEAGGMFAALAKRLGAVELSDNLRQAAPWEQAALTSIRDGDVATGLRAYVDQGRVHTTDTAPAIRERIVSDWYAARATASEGVAMIAIRREDVRALNTAARARLVDDGRLGRPELAVDDDHLGERSFAPGDEVVVLTNTYRLGLHNGSRGTVAEVDPDAATVTIRDAAGVDRVLDRRLVADRLDHAYAMTCHKAQGLTVDVALLYGTAALSREAGYVGLSRGRQGNHMYAVADELDRALQGGSVAEETDDLPRHREAAAPTAGLAGLAAAIPPLVDALSRSATQELAIDAVPSVELLAGRLAALRTRQVSRSRERRDGSWTAGRQVAAYDTVDHVVAR